jgi:hypothetical protein
MAEEKSRSYAGAKNVLLLKFDDLFIAILSFGSFFLLLAARYITIALYYFYWVLLSVCSPMMILCYVFPKTAPITGNLFRGLIEVASWKILWALMSAMLASLSFGSIYQTQGSYVTLIVMNFVIAIALLFTPMIVHSMVGQGVHATAQSIGTTAAMAAVMAPTRLVRVQQVTRQVLSDSHKYAAHKFSSAKNRIQSYRPPRSKQ